MNASTLLIADDNAGVRRVLERLLARPGRRMIVAEDGLAALKAAREQRPDAIILDVRMPGLSGYEVCRKLRDDDPTREIPILLLTGLSELADQMEGLQLGADAYIAKPFDMRELTARVDALLGRHAGHEA